jgi:hypothetical protein
MQPYRPIYRFRQVRLSEPESGHPLLSRVCRTSLHVFITWCLVSWEAVFVSKAVVANMWEDWEVWDGVQLSCWYWYIVIPDESVTSYRSIVRAGESRVSVQTWIRKSVNPAGVCVRVSGSSCGIRSSSLQQTTAFYKKELQSLALHFKRTNVGNLKQVLYTSRAAYLL